MEKGGGKREGGKGSYKRRRRGERGWKSKGGGGWKEEIIMFEADSTNPHPNFLILQFLVLSESHVAAVVSPLARAVIHILWVEVPALAEGNGMVGRLQLHSFQDPHHHTQLAIPLLSEASNVQWFAKSYPLQIMGIMIQGSYFDSNV